MYICAIPHVIIYRVRHVFQKLLLFFLCEVILVIHCCFQNKNLIFFFDSLVLKPLELYVNLVGQFVAY
jgi:hypothetical protein